MKQVTPRWLCNRMKRRVPCPIPNKNLTSLCNNCWPPTQPRKKKKKQKRTSHQDNWHRPNSVSTEIIARANVLRICLNTYFSSFVDVFLARRLINQNRTRRRLLASNDRDDALFPKLGRFSKHSVRSVFRRSRNKSPLRRGTTSVSLSEGSVHG